jgi:O-antigen ligase
MSYDDNMTSLSTDLTDESVISLKSERVSFFTLLLCPLIVLMTTVSYIEGATKITITYGALCGIAFLFNSLFYGIKFYKETIFFLLFILWSLAGYLIATSLILFLLSLGTVIQLFVLFLMISNVCTNIVNIKYILFSFLVGGCIVAYLVIRSGDYAFTEFTGQRTAGIVGNANQFALLIDGVLIILLWFFQLAKSKIFKAIFLCPVPLCFKLVVASASRSGFLGFVIILALWYGLFYFRLTFKKPLLALFVTVIMIGFGIYVVKNLAYTMLLQRFTEARYITEGAGEASAVSRVAIMKEGIRVGIGHPIFGVGLGNYLVYNTMGKFAHNNYVEVLADTGLVGWILYYGIYYCIIVKISKLRKIMKSPMLNMIIVYIVFDMLVWQMFGVTYALKETWIFVAVGVGYLNNCSQDQSSLTAVQSDSSY